jgi:hypothetical protein
VWAAGVEEPFRPPFTARVGVVSRFDPAGWRCFAARDQPHEDVYLSWLHDQPVYRHAVLTVQSNYFLRKPRSSFRERFRIDVVRFRPDELNWAGWCTSRGDTWLLVSNWTKRRMLSARKYSARLIDTRVTIVAEEEFG